MSKQFRLKSGCATLILLLAGWGLRASQVVETDICVYGGTSGGIVAAVQAARMGKTVSLAVFSTHLGGLTTGGLGATDYGNKATIGGISREFYRRVGQRYGKAEAFFFEPHAALAVYQAWLGEVGVVPHWNQQLASVTKSGRRITQLTMEDGTIYRAKMFIDASYEGDLMAQAGVSFTFGREGTNVYGETLNGIRTPGSGGNQFPVAVDPWVVPGDPASGLLPFVQAGEGGTPGDGDNRIQAFNYRMCFTQVATNRLPHVVPPNYDPARYELLGRLIDGRVAAGETLTLNSFFSVIAMPNGKTDMNNSGGFSSDYIGMNYTYPTNTYAARAQLDREHLEYIQGMIQYLANSPHSPASLRSSVLNWGPCKDEWPETGGYPPQIYIREARRMVSDYVVIQGDCSGTHFANDSICLGSYNMDSHNCQRLAVNGVVRNEGDVQIAPTRPYPLSYRAIVPRVGECENLFVPFALSASHIAFGSTRMEPVFMMECQSAATAAAFAIDDDVPVQKVNYAKLALQLAADGQILTWGGGNQSSNGIIVDNSDRGVVIVGDWTDSTAQAGFWSTNYIHDGNTGKGGKSVRFTPNLPQAGEYQVALRWTTNSNRAANTPVDIIYANGTNTLWVNQTRDNGTWVPLLTTNFNAGTNASLLLRNTGTSGYVVADAARWLSTATRPRVQMVATDPVASQTGKRAKITFIRGAEDAVSAVTVNYSLSGTASNGVDFVALPGFLTCPAGSTTSSLLIEALSNTIPTGDKLLTITLQAGADYVVGTCSNAVVRILQTPFDAWRFARFSAAELADASIGGPAADPDQDGARNYQEFVAGTDPHDPASVLRVKIQAATQTALVSFDISSNRTSALQYCENLISGGWFDATNYYPFPTNRSESYPDSMGRNRYYRLRLQ